MATSGGDIADGAGESGPDAGTFLATNALSNSVGAAISQ